MDHNNTLRLLQNRNTSHCFGNGHNDLKPNRFVAQSDLNVTTAIGLTRAQSMSMQHQREGGERERCVRTNVAD